MFIVQTYTDCAHRQKCELVGTDRSLLCAAKALSFYCIGSINLFAELLDTYMYSLARGLNFLWNESHHAYVQSFCCLISGVVRGPKYTF